MPAASNLGSALREELVALAAPLTAAASSPDGVARLLRAFGRGDGLAGSSPLQTALERVAAPLQRIETLSEDALGSWPGILQLLQLAGEMFDALRALDALAASPDIGPQAAGLGRELAEQLLALHLRNRHATLWRIFQLLTLVTPAELAAVEAMVEHDGKPVRLGTRRDRFHFERVEALLQQPLPTLAEHYFPNDLAVAADAHLGAARLFPLLHLLVQELGLSSFDDQRPTGSFAEPAPAGEVNEADHFGPEHDHDADPPPDIPTQEPVDPTPLYEANRPRFVMLLPGLIVDGQAVPARFGVAAELSSARHPGAARGLIVKPLGLLALSESRRGWLITIDGQGEAPGWLFGPAGAGLAPSDAAPAAASIKVTVARESAPGTPAFVFGAANGSRLEIGALKLGIEAKVVGARAVIAAAIDASSGAVVLAPDDGFLGSLLPAGGLRGSFDLGLGWSSDAGLALRGAAGLEARIGVSRSLGGLTLKSLRLRLLARDASITAEVSSELSASIGPVRALVDGLGVAARVDFPENGGNLGVARLELGPTLPSGVGLVVEAQGVLTGGGFLFRDEAQHLYAGAMQLSLHELITLKAFGLIATRHPDGSAGYSLLVFITAEDFRPVPLGLGFTLNGVGGMVGVHRSFDAGVLREGLKSGTLGTLLFPRDPVGNAPALIRSLALAFPARRGSYLVGLLLRIGWGTPTLVRFDLGLILEFGARRRLLVLGRISALLPSEHNDLVRLNMEALGVIDFDAGTAEIDALLVDSRLAHQFPITGAMALRARFGSGPGPSFILALGGFNPRFTPPAGVPQLPRLAIALSAGDNPRLTCAAYFALTANTVQFGARAQLYAAAAGFSVVGDVGFDVLLHISPLHFIADFSASLQLKRGSRSLFKVSLKGELEGPRPLRVSGKASFEILWCDFSVRFDKTLVAGEKPPLPPAVDVLLELQRALAAPSSWSTQVARGQAHGVALRKLAAGDGLVLDPLGRLMVRQQVVPLNSARDIDRFGGSPLAGARRFALAASVGGSAQAVSAVQDDFAPAQFFDMSDDDKLAAPSFERMDAGIVFGSDAIAFDAAEVVSAPLAYEEIVVDDLHLPSPPPQPFVFEMRALIALSATGAAALAAVRRTGRARFRNLAVSGAAPGDATEAGPALPDVAVRLLPAVFAVMALDASEAPGTAAQSFSTSRDTVRRLNRSGARFTSVPLHELASTD